MSNNKGGNNNMITSAPRLTGEIKNSELAHLFQATDGRLYDRHVEDLFDSLFYGRELDYIFKTNFTEYFRMLTGWKETVPSEVFLDAIAARAWIGAHFGLIHITTTPPDFVANDPDLSHCTHFAILRSFATPEGTNTACAHSELYAALLAVVEVYRVLARRYTEERFKPVNTHPC